MSVTLTLSNQLLCILSFYNKIWNKVLGVTLPVVGRYSLYKRILPESWLLHNPEPLVEANLNN
jgi:hypothetical protein